MNSDNLMRTISIAISAILVAFIVFWITRYYLSDSGSKKTTIQLTQDDLDIVYGEDTASISVFMYSNYGCPYCRKFFTEVYPELENEYIKTGKIKLVMRLTLSTKNQDLMNSLKAAVCVNRYGNYEYLHQLMLSQSNIVFTSDFQDMLNEFIDKDPLVAQCMLAGESEAYLQRNLQEFEKLGLQGTPSFVVQNTVIHGFSDYPRFRQMLDRKSVV